MRIIELREYFEELAKNQEVGDPEIMEFINENWHECL